MIVLATLNAKYIHASFGLRYLLANLGPLRARRRLLEFDIHQRPVDIAEAILARRPKNRRPGRLHLERRPKRRKSSPRSSASRPEMTVILGGPEVSYEVEEQEIVRLADHVITGEADLKFAEVCREILAGTPPARENHPGGDARSGATRAALRTLHRRRRRAPRHLRGGVARLSVHVRILPVVAGRAGAAVSACRYCWRKCRGCWIAA